MNINNKPSCINYGSTKHDKNTTYRKTQMMKVLPVAVAISVLQPNLKTEKFSKDTFEFQNRNEYDYFITPKDGITANNYKNISTYEINNRLNKKLKKLDEKIKKLMPAPESMPKVVNTKLDVAHTKYYGSADALNQYFIGGVLEGKGQKLIEFQNKYGVNALFLAAITMVESGGGKSAVARNKYNVAGIMTKQNGKYTTKRFNNVDECLESLAKNIKNNYINQNRETIEKINKKYAEDKYWGDSIVFHMNKILKEKQLEYIR